MKHSMIKTALVALAMAMSASLSLAVEPQPPTAKPASPAVKKKAATPQVEPVDINSASKEALKKLPGIGDAEADKIIAGRPYLTKAHLQTRNVLPSGVFQGLRHLVVAKQKDAKFAKEAKR